jgi:hypothetical protein
VAGSAEYIESLAHYFACVAKQLESWQAHSREVLEPVFRGQASVAWELVPALLRAGPFDKTFEDRLLREFEQRARPFLRQSPHGRLQWMALAQHHGLPTRLLDWSESALVALFFALQEPHVDLPHVVHNVGDGCVWLLNRTELHARSGLPRHIVLLDAAEREWPENLVSLVEGERGGVVVFTPAHISSRMPVQKAAFTLFGSAPESLEALRDDRSLLARLVVPRERARQLQRELTIAGITRATLFPDLDGIACEVWERESTRRQDELARRAHGPAPRGPVNR